MLQNSVNRTITPSTEMKEIEALILKSIIKDFTYHSTVFEYGRCGAKFDKVETDVPNLLAKMINTIFFAELSDRVLTVHTKRSFAI